MEIYFPQKISCLLLGKDTLSDLCADNFQKEYKILFYVDSVGCSSCRMKLLEWQLLIAEAQTLFPYKVGFIFYFQPKNIQDIKNLLLTSKFKYPVFIDTNDSINLLNQFSQLSQPRLSQFPKSIPNQCFLLNKENKVLAVGNPTLSLRVWDSFKNIIEEDDNTGPKHHTNVSLDKKIHDFGKITKDSISSTVFIITNNGNKPLIISRISVSCGCTDVAWNREPIKPGESTTIKAEITPYEIGYFNKNLVVYCNSDNSPIVLTLKGIANN